MHAKRVLIANRGEIAIRVAKAVKELGHIAIGVYTDSEINAYHNEFCQEHLKLEGSSNKETYLNIEQIISLCLKHKIDAVHPGYGFLSENAKFADTLAKNKIIFIGPNAGAIDAMGDKAKSKQLALKVGVPVVPGSTGEVKDVEQALKIATEIGYPILLKAVAGGGGKGMRVCQAAGEITKNFEAVQREALSSFGYAGVLVEKYITNPHHIEVQILADKKGNIFHFFERECSIQRRHQKIIEEAPSPFIGQDQALRSAICQAAVKLAAAVKYDSAGTVEFVMGDDKKFYFLEMNTRIQVEHPITEEITGIDLVANMIRAAFSQSLDFSTQEEIKLHGHAIEARICAEDPVSMLPAPGTVHLFDYTPTVGVRFDHCIYAGYNVKSDFDPMIGKLICLGINRSVAIRKMAFALKQLHITGMLTNIELLRFVLAEEKFLVGNYTTHYLKSQEEKINSLSFSKIDPTQSEHLQKISQLLFSQLEQSSET